MKPGIPRRRSGYVVLVAPVAPPYGGMGLQATLLLERMQADGLTVTLVPSNPPFPSGLRAFAAVPGLRTLLRCGVFCARLWRNLASTEVLHILACSWIYFFAVVSPAVFLGRLRRKRVIINYHGGEVDRFLGRFGWLARPVFRLADVVTAPSGFLAGVIERRMHTAVAIVPNVVDLGAFSFRERLSVAPRMLVTRHLEPLYDIECILKAFRELQAQHSEASLWIVGSGTQEGYLRNMAEVWRLKGVRFFGYVPYAELPAIYGQCDILLNASHADNFPGSLLEAAAAGLVVISTRVGGIPYIFENGASALLVDPGEPAALSAAVRRVLEEPGLAVRLARGALQRCRQYDWNNVRRSLYSVYGIEPRERGAQTSGIPDQSVALPHVGAGLPAAEGH